MTNKTTHMIRFVMFIVLLVSCLIPVSAGSASSLTMTVLDVGQADCILMTCNGETMLVDTARVKSADSVLSHLEATLAENETAYIRYIVLTHSHADHIGCTAQVMARYSVGSVLLPPVETDTMTFETTMQAISNAGVTCVYPSVGDIFRLGAATITVYAPCNTIYTDLKTAQLY